MYFCGNNKSSGSTTEKFLSLTFDCSRETFQQGVGQRHYVMAEVMG
jgi:hypothetical protein